MNTTKITFNRELNEYRVRLFIDGVYQAGADYYTDDKRDAKDTAAHMTANGGESDKTTDFAKEEQAEYEEVALILRLAENAEIIAREEVETKIPTLDHDLMMSRRYGVAVSASGRMERRIVWRLFEHLTRYGWHVLAVDDGDETTAAGTAKAAMELIFNLDEAIVIVSDGVMRQEIVLILGNDESIIHDYSYSPRNNFLAAMEAFDVGSIL